MCAAQRSPRHGVALHLRVSIHSCRKAHNLADYGYSKLQAHMWPDLATVWLQHWAVQGKYE